MTPTRRSAATKSTLSGRMSARSYVQQGNPWKTRHDRLEDLIVMLMQHSGMSAQGEPRNVVNGLIPRPLLRE
jgi:hypothetical protein